MSEFENKTAFVTGGGSGIGRATSVALSVSGVNVAIADINEQTGIETVDHIKSLGNQASFYKLDLNNNKEIKNVIKQVYIEKKKIDFAVNNAGVGGNFEPIHKTNYSNWINTLNINLNAVFLCMKHEINFMIKQNFGRIVNVSSMAGLKGVGGGASYSASKHGVLGLTKSAAIEYGSQNIRINAVCPGFIDTDLIKKVPEKILEFNKKINPMRRLGYSSEVANTILWLLSENSSFVNGHSINIDGGYGTL